MPKNIVIFSDGTGQEGGKAHNTNVYKLFNLILDRSPEQIAFYDRGLGTGWKKLTGNVSGSGISKNIQECYEFLFDNFQSGDQIYLFGFSRGAATVRSLSGFIDLIGILPKSRRGLINQAYDIYKITDDDERKAKAKEFVGRHHTMWTRVKFLGVWDTVAALGLPIKSISALIDRIPWWRHEFHNFKLSPSVENAYHALAIDDERKTFHPLVWEPETMDYQTMQQVWFCGMHTDVGGGYPESQLSDIALEWILQKATENGLRIYDKHGRTCNPEPNGVMHDSRGHGWTKLFRKERRMWDEVKHGKPTIHESVTLRTRNRHNQVDPRYSPWILGIKGGYEVEQWKHPGQWLTNPDALQEWCKYE